MNKSDNAIRWTNNITGKEYLSIDEDGSFYVKGKKVAEDVDVYHAFKEWLKESTFEKKEIK